MDAICFIDLETTGVRLDRDYPIQIGAVLVDQETLTPIKDFESFIRPPSSVSSTPVALAVHGIALEQLAAAPAPRDVLESFFKTMGVNFCFGGWNVCFDVSFIRRLCHDFGMDDIYLKVNHRHLDVQSVVQFLRMTNNIPSEIRSLSDLCAFLGVKRSSMHSAIEDARITHMAYCALVQLSQTQRKRSAKE